MTDLAYTVEQALGLVSTGCAIARPMCKQKRNILILNIIINVLISSNYILIGRFGSAPMVCGVTVIQSIVSLRHHARGTSSKLGEILLFSALYLGFGFFGVASVPGFVWAVNRQNLLESMPIFGTLTMMAAIFAPTEQDTRKFLLVNGIIWTTYGIIQGSSTFMTNAVSGLSAGVALIRYRQKTA